MTCSIQTTPQSAPCSLSGTWSAATLCTIGSPPGDGPLNQLMLQALSSNQSGQGSSATPKPAFVLSNSIPTAPLSSNQSGQGSSATTKPAFVLSNPIPTAPASPLYWLAPLLVNLELLSKSPLPAGSFTALRLTRFSNRCFRFGVSFATVSEACGPKHMVKRARRSYDVLKYTMIRSRGQVEEPSLAIRALCGSCSGVLAVVSSMPFETLREKLWGRRKRVRPNALISVPRVALLSAMVLPLFDLVRDGFI